MRDTPGVELGHAHAAVRLVHQQALRHQLEHRLARGRRAEIQIRHQLPLPQRLARAGSGPP